MRTGTKIVITTGLIFAAAGVALYFVNKPKTPPPIAETPPPAAASSAPVKVGSKRFVVNKVGLADVTIDAPLEKFRGKSESLAGTLDIDASDLRKTKGEVSVDLTSFTTFTFNDKEKDEAQTGHARNWFDLSAETVKSKPDYATARFLISSIEEVAEPVLAKVAVTDGARKVTLRARGTFRLHGRETEKVVALSIAFSSENELRFKTTEPIAVSLSEHDVKPRDTAGKFLEGALTVVGKKIDDKASVTLEGSAALAKP